MIPKDTQDHILSLMASGDSLRSICRQEGMPSIWQVMRELRVDADFSQHYARAMLDRADAKFEELDAVSEEAESTDSAVKIAGLRLKADNIKWQLARMNSKKYGDRVQTEVSGTLGHEHTHRISEQTAQFLADLRASAGNSGPALPLPD